MVCSSSCSYTRSKARGRCVYSKLLLIKPWLSRFSAWFGCIFKTQWEALHFEQRKTRLVLMQRHATCQFNISQHLLMFAVHTEGLKRQETQLRVVLFLWVWNCLFFMFWWLFCPKRHSFPLVYAICCSEVALRHMAPFTTYRLCRAPEARKTLHMIPNSRKDLKGFLFHYLLTQLFRKFS